MFFNQPKKQTVRKIVVIKEADKKITDEVINVIKTTFEPTGSFDTDKKRAENYAKIVGMDEANTKMAVIMATEGRDTAAKKMLEEFNGDYFAMRMKYG